MLNRRHVHGLDSSIITVIVNDGEHEKKFAVHEALITKRSRFFRSAMQGQWKEAKDRTVSMPDQSPEVFSVYLQALYANHVTLPDDFDPGSTFRMLGRLFVLAEMLGDVQTKNIIVEAILNKGKDYSISHLLPYMAMVQDIYDGTPGPCRVRNLVVDLISRQPYTPHLGPITEAAFNFNECSPDFLTDLFNGLLLQRNPIGAGLRLEEYVEKSGSRSLRVEF